MRRTLTLLVTTLTLSLTGCATTGPPPAAPPPPPSAPRASATPADPPATSSSATGQLADTAYLATIRSQGLDTGDDQRDISRALLLCAALGAGNVDLDDIAKILTDNGYTPRDAGLFIDAATTAYCPEDTPG